MHDTTAPDIFGVTAEIVVSFVSNNQVRSAELPELISTIHASLTKIIAPDIAQEPLAEVKPAVPIKKSVTDDYLICLDDGKRFKSLKRHLAQLGMTPSDYRAKWGLPASYPMVAPGYAAQRSKLAKAIGLGSRRTQPGAPVPETAPASALKAAAKRTMQAGTVVTAPVAAASVKNAPAKRRGRPKKAA